MKAEQAYVPTSGHDDQLNESFCDHVQFAVNTANTHYTILMGELDPKVGKKQGGDQAEGEYDLGIRNSRVDLLGEIAKREYLTDNYYLLTKTGKPEVNIDVPE